MMQVFAYRGIKTKKILKEHLETGISEIMLKFWKLTSGLGIQISDSFQKFGNCLKRKKDEPILGNLSAVKNCLSITIDGRIIHNNLIVFEMLCCITVGYIAKYLSSFWMN